LDPDPYLVIFWAFDFYQIMVAAILIVLLACSALISGSEVALFSLTPTDFSVKEGKMASDKEKILIKLLDKPKKLLATILVANNFVNIAIVLLFDQLGEAVFEGVNTVFWSVNLRFVFEVVAVTFLILLFGEILPKVYANRNRVKFSHFMAYPLNFLDWLFYLVSTPMRFVTVKLHKGLGKSVSTGISVDQLSQALELTGDQETTQEEQKILQGIVSFGNTDAKQVMRPRIDIFAVPIETNFKNLKARVIENGFSRIPVFEGNVDKIKGVIYIKDLLPHLKKENYAWQNLIREAYYVPENKKLDDLLNDFKAKKKHLAIVVDEYGGTSGLLSLEDIIEEIVGDINDEFDDENLVFSQLDDTHFVFEGKTPLKDFYRIIQVEDSTKFEEAKGDAETLAGFLLEISGNFPEAGQKVTFENFGFEIEAVDNRRIKQIKLSIN
jgi:gliding motility-associated protein GldE